MKKWMKWGLVGAGGVSVAVLGFAGVAIASSRSRMVERYEVSSYELPLVTSVEDLAEGKRLYVSRGCGDCHGADGAGKTIMDAPPGRISGINLTKYAKNATSDDYVRALRHGVAEDGRPLVFMPSHEYSGISDEELSRIVAYVEQLPEKDSSLPENEVRPLGNVLHFVGAFPLLSAEHIDHDKRIESWPERQATVEFGASLAVGCTGCHGAGFSGGPIPGAPPELGNPRNLTPHATGLAEWTEADFIRAMREGKRRDGSALDPKQMPWPALGSMNDTELSALYKFLRTVPAKPHGQR